MDEDSELKFRENGFDENENEAYDDETAHENVINF